MKYLSYIVNGGIWRDMQALGGDVAYLISQVNKMAKTQADLQAALDAQAVVITAVQAEVASLNAAIANAAPVDLTPQVNQTEAQTAALHALLPAAPSPTA